MLVFLSMVGKRQTWETVAQTDRPLPLHLKVVANIFTHTTSTPPSTPPTPSRERSLTVALPSVFKLREFDCYLIAQFHSIVLSAQYHSIVLSSAPWHMGCNVSRTNHLALASLIRLSSDGNVAITFQPVFFCMNIFRGRDPTGH